jgi:hypothetical protein
MLKERILKTLQKRPMSARSLAKLLQAGKTPVNRECAVLLQQGAIERDGMKWRAVVGANLRPAFTFDWTLDTARETYILRACSNAAYIPADEPTAMSFLRRELDESRAYLRLNDPTFLAEREREEATAIEFFEILRQAQTYEPQTFLDILEGLALDAFDVVGPIVDSYAAFPDRTMEGRRAWFAWHLMGWPVWKELPDRIRIKPCALPDRDELLLAMARNFADADRMVDEDSAELLLDMLLVLAPRAVCFQVERVRRYRAAGGDAAPEMPDGWSEFTRDTFDGEALSREAMTRWRERP